MSVDHVIEAARACLRTPFRHQGRQPGRGLDCGGLVIHAFTSAGYTMTDEPGYTREPQPAWMRAVLERVFVPVDDLRPGDVLWMRFDMDPQHLAIWTGVTIIHAFLRSRKVVEHRMDSAWWLRVVKRYRHRELVI